MSVSIVRKSEANIRKSGRTVSSFNTALSMSDSKLSMFGSAMNWITPILLIFTAGLRITGTVQPAFALARDEIKCGNS